MSITLEDELPVGELPTDPTWLENFCFDGYDHCRNIGFWIHCGRWWRDPSIWREQVLVYWIDGTYLVHRAWGSRPSDRGPAAALLDLVCEEAGHRWRIRYRGPVRQTTSAELYRGPLTEASQDLLELDLSFGSEFPVWHMSGISGEQWGKFHIEQVGRIEGTICLDGQHTVAMDGSGWRDHSRGPRDVSSMARHCWIHGRLPGERAFALTVMDNLGPGGGFVRGLNRAVVWDRDRIHEARCPDPPFLEHAGAPTARFEMTLEYAGERLHLIADAPRNLPHSTGGHMDCFDGVTPGQAHIVTYEQGTVFTVDGESLDGHTERSFLLHR